MLPARLTLQWIALILLLTSTQLTSAGSLPVGWRLLYHDSAIQPPDCGLDIGSIFDLDCLAALEGGTVGRLERWSGVCSNVPETISKVILDKDGPFFAPVDLKWETVINAKAARTRHYYRSYIGREPTCSELAAGVNQPNNDHLNSNWYLKSVACSPAAAEAGRKPDFFCQYMDAQGGNQAAIDALNIAAPGELPSLVLLKMQVTWSRIKESMNRCPNPAANRVMVLDLNLAPPGSSDGVRDIRAANARTLNPWDYPSTTREHMMPTDGVFAAMYYYLATSGAYSHAFTEAGFQDPVNDVAVVDSIVCNNSGNSVYNTDVLGEASRYEMDAMIRDFLDFAADGVLGNDSIPIEGNLWTLLEFIAMTGASDQNSNPAWGYTCQPNDICHDAVNEAFGALVDPGADTPPSCAITGPAEVFVGETFRVQWTASNSDLVETLGWWGPLPQDLSALTGSGQIGTENSPREWSGQWGGALRLAAPGSAGVTLRVTRGSQTATCSYQIVARDPVGCL